MRALLDVHVDFSRVQGHNQITDLHMLRRDGFAVRRQQREAATQRRCTAWVDGQGAGTGAPAYKFGNDFIQRQPLTLGHVSGGDRGVFCKVDGGAHTGCAMKPEKAI